ncbi:retrovirus-related pol polyprotein from transposon RE1 [Tanacetum coccineum]
MSCFSKSLQGSATLLAFSFSNKAVSRSFTGTSTTPNKILSREMGSACNSNGGGSEEGAASPSLPVMSHPMGLASSLSISFILMPRYAIHQNANLAQAFTSQCMLLKGTGMDKCTLTITCPYTPQQNGRAERKHRHLVETGLAMLFHAHVPASYWVDAFSSATYIINRLPTKLLGNHSPFELLYSRLPNYTNFRAFGCLVYPYLRDYSAHKLAPRSIPCVFIGYNPQYKGYKCLDPDSSRIYITRHARFDEVTFPFASTANPNALSTLQLCTFLEDGPPISDAPVPESRPTDTRPSSSSPCGLCPVPTTAAEPIHEP